MEGYEIRIDLDRSPETVHAQRDALAMIIEGGGGTRVIGGRGQVVMPEEGNELPRALVRGLPRCCRNKDEKSQKTRENSNHPKPQNQDSIGRICGE